jgi:hypothetical protein
VIVLGFNAVTSYRKKRVEYEIEYDLCVICVGAIEKGIQKNLRSKLMGVRSESKERVSFLMKRFVWLALMAIRMCCQMSVMAAFVAVEGECEACWIRGAVVAVEDSKLR